MSAGFQTIDRLEVAPALVGMGWPVRESFLRYLAGLPDGRASAVGGAREDARWGFVFPPRVARFDEHSGEGVLHFGGTVRFSGHFGMLALDVVRPSLQLGAMGGTLFADDVPLAEVDYSFAMAGGAATWTLPGVRLTAPGVDVFGGMYEPGADLAPMRIRLERPAS
ncbi:HtaA domain-containing protein [Microbacterium sp. RD1]|uniref:HtaA domain-containing protein n=1 Tax=Microbacterium sp. RD1 TaxID=3457313 RepID=UPI003FA5D4B5